MKSNQRLERFNPIVIGYLVIICCWQLLFTSYLQAQSLGLGARVTPIYSSRQTLGPYQNINDNHTTSRTIDKLTYPRVRKLPNGDLFMVFQDGQLAWDIYGMRSKDGGKSWSQPFILKSYYNLTNQWRNDYRCFMTPDLLVMNDGRLMLCYSYRNNVGYGSSIFEEAHSVCGVEVMISNDDGYSWSSPTVAYTGRNWEPYLLQLSTGEIQLYLTATIENYYAYVAMVRSSDLGKTWTPTYGTQPYPRGLALSQTVIRDANNNISFAGDGMVAAVELQNRQGIIFCIENDYNPTNGPFIVYSSMKNNWDYSVPALNTVTYPDNNRKWPIATPQHSVSGYAPYMLKLPNGEIVLQYNGSHNNVGGIWMTTGDTTGKNFQNYQRPYTEGGWWGSVALKSPDTLISLATWQITGEPDVSKRIIYKEAYINYPMQIKYKNPTDGWDDIKPIFLGANSATQASIKCKLWNDNLMVNVKWNDKMLNRKDTVKLYIQPSDIQNTTLTNGVLECSITPTNYRIRKYQNGNFVNVVNQAVKYNPTSSGTLDNDIDNDIGFEATLTLPTNLIKNTIVDNEKWHFHLTLADYTTAGFTTLEDLSFSTGSNPSTWMTATLQTVAICESVRLVKLITEGSWTYYGPAGYLGNQYPFAIDHTPTDGNTNTFTAEIWLNNTCNQTVFNATNINEKEGIFVAGQYWNISLLSGSLNGKVNVRYFPNLGYITEMKNQSLSFQTHTSATYRSDSIYFKTASVLSLPNDLRPDGKGLTKMPYPLTVSSKGVYNGQNYVQFNDLISINNTGGGILQKVANQSQTVKSIGQGAFRFNRNTKKFEVYTGTDWNNIGIPK